MGEKQESKEGRKSEEVVEKTIQRPAIDESSTVWNLPKDLVLGNSRIILRGEGRRLLEEEDV
ncbi:hypothetical protein N9873_04820 [Akkermansiaceae bacterium]|nr:hypothetical protein [Akkermansiaceae bacterium]